MVGLWCRMAGLATAILGCASLVYGQPVTSPRADASVGTGWQTAWDDETHLGVGVPLSAGAALVLGDRVRVGLEVDSADHVRDAGYLRSEGRLIGVSGAVDYLFGARLSRTRAFAGLGIGVLHATGTFIEHSLLPGVLGPPTPGPDSRTAWRLTAPAVDLHGGLRVAVTSRLTVRPDLHWRATVGHRSAKAVEPPIWAIGAGFHLDFRFR